MFVYITIDLYYNYNVIYNQHSSDNNKMVFQNITNDVELQLNHTTAIIYKFNTLELLNYIMHTHSDVI